LTPTLFVNVTQMNISYIVVESVTNSTIYIMSGTIYTNATSTIYPTINNSMWNNIVIGLSSYNTITDTNWHCNVAGGNCNALSNSTVLGTIFGMNVSCPSNSVLDASNLSAIVCQCFSGYFGNGPNCHPCNPACLNCTDAPPTACTACNLSNYR
jgi:hypothetical protein